MSDWSYNGVAVKDISQYDMVIPIFFKLMFYK